MRRNRMSLCKAKNRPMSLGGKNNRPFAIANRPANPPPSHSPPSEFAPPGAIWIGRCCFLCWLGAQMSGNRSATSFPSHLLAATRTATTGHPLQDWANASTGSGIDRFSFGKRNMLPNKKLELFAVVVDVAGVGGGWAGRIGGYKWLQVQRKRNPMRVSSKNKFLGI